MAIKITEDGNVKYENEPTVERELLPNITDGEQYAKQAEEALERIEEIAESIPEDYTQLLQDVATLEDSVSDLEEDVEELQNNYTPLAEDVGQIKNDLSEKADKSEALSAYIVETETGAIASFTDGADDVPVKDLSVAIEPVQSGSGDPSPSNVRPISGWTGANVTRVGNNLFDKSNTANILNNADFSGTTIGVGSQRCVVFIPCKPNRTYMASRKAVLTNERFAIGYTTELPAVDVAVANVTLAPSSQTVGNLMSLSVTTGSDAKYVVVWAYWDNMTDALDDLQIELGSTATAYEPYQGETYEVDWTTEAGTVYGGTLDVTTGVLTVDRAGVDLGTQDYATSTQGNLIFWTTLNNGSETDNPSGICSEYPMATDPQYATDKTCRLYGSSTYHFCRLAIRDSAYDNYTTAQFKTAMNGVQLVYELATPQTYQLTPQEVKTVLGQNNIFADTGDVTVQYRADTKLYIDKVISA